MAWKKHIEVKVLVNGMAAQEHDDDDDDEGSNGRYTITKYIEAVSGVQFAVQFELKPSFFFRAELFVFQIYIDGKRLDSAIVAKSRFEEQPRGCTGNFHGITRSHGQTWSVEKFRFSEIKISDDQSPDIDPKLKDRIADLGSITLKVHRKHKGVLKAAGTTGSGWGWDELHEIGQVPEKALKGQALSHEITLDAPQFMKPCGVWCDAEYLDGKDRPFAVFNFKYRSRKALQDLRIIPATPIPVPLEERPIEELTGEEALELLRRQRERQESTISQAKAELNPSQGIKREYEHDEEYDSLLASARPNKVARTLTEGELIDLSED